MERHGGSGGNAALTVRRPERLGALGALWQGTEREIWLMQQGESMVPAILPGARLRLRYQEHVPAVGQIVAFRRGRSLVVHRLKTVAWTDAGEQWLICQGDRNAFQDEPIPLADLVGVVVTVKPPSAAARTCLALRRTLRRWRLAS